MSNRKEALGKGIRALLEDIDADMHTSRHQEEKAIVSQGQSFVLSLDAIEVNPFQPRLDFDKEKLQELADSIKIHGVIQPITVRKISAKKYQLIAGERRLKASQMAGLKEIPSLLFSSSIFLGISWFDNSQFIAASLFSILPVMFKNLSGKDVPKPAA